MEVGKGLAQCVLLFFIVAGGWRLAKKLGLTLQPPGYLPPLPRVFPRFSTAVLQSSPIPVIGAQGMQSCCIVDSGLRFLTLLTVAKLNPSQSPKMVMRLRRVGYWVLGLLCWARRGAPRLHKYNLLSPKTGGRQEPEPPNTFPKTAKRAVAFMSRNTRAPPSESTPTNRLLVVRFETC